METSDTLVTGIVLLLVLPSLFVEIPASRRGGYNAAFWRLELDDKLDHIAEEPRHWARVGMIWLPNLVLVGAGMTAFTFQLSTTGEGTLAFLALGAYLVGAAAWLVGTLLQTSAVGQAAAVRAGTGETPDWLRAFWNAGWAAEVVFIAAANAAFVVWGLAMLRGGYPADWMGWTAIVLGLLALALVASTREGFPHLGVIVPIVLGVALLLY